MCMDTKGGAMPKGSNEMYQGKLGGNIGRGGANFTSRPPEVRQAQVATYTDSKGNKQYIDDPLPTEGKGGSVDGPVAIYGQEGSSEGSTPALNASMKAGGEVVAAPEIQKKSEFQWLWERRNNAAKFYDKLAEEERKAEYTNPAIEADKWLMDTPFNEKSKVGKIATGAMLATGVVPLASKVMRGVGEIAARSPKILDSGSAVTAVNIRRGIYDQYLTEDGQILVDSKGAPQIPKKLLQVKGR